jgi:glutaredoxin 3
MKQIRLYTRGICGWCLDAKEYLTQRGIAFQEIDVGRDPGANAEMKRLSGQQYVPTITVDGHVLANFDVDQLAAFLKTIDGQTAPPPK